VEGRQHRGGGPRQQRQRGAVRLRRKGAQGARASFKTLSDEPFRHIVVDIPNAGYSVEEINAGAAERAAE
jgi:hypothetical protein